MGKALLEGIINSQRKSAGLIFDLIDYHLIR